MQPCERTAEELLVRGAPCRLVDRLRHQEIVLGEHDVGHGRRTRYAMQLSQSVGLVESARTDLDDKPAPCRLHQPGVAPERSGGSGRADGRARRGHQAAEPDATGP